jgi:hypothetical protein
MPSKAFFRTRELTVSCPHDEYVRRSKRIQETFAYELMPLRQLKRYVDLVAEFGFNSLQLHELWESYETVGWRISPRALRAKLRALADYAHSRRMTTTLFVWGSGPVDIYANRGNMNDWHKWENICPCSSRGSMRILRDHYERQAALAGHFDHFISHWADPGGCQGGKCDFRTALRLHNEMVRHLRRVNPRIASTFSLWFFGAAGVPGCENWPGYGGFEDILDAGILDESVGFAQGGRLEITEARRIAKAGRRLGVWAWYLADNEICPSLHVHTKIMGDYFGALPAEASRLAEWHTIDSNCHVLNLASLYVAGGFLKDPRADGRAALRAFAEFAFGPHISGAVFEGLAAVAATRCATDYRRVKAPLDGKPISSDLGDEREAPERHLRIARKGLAVMKNIRPDGGFRSPLEGFADPALFLNALRSHLERIAEYAEFRARLRTAKARGGRIRTSSLPPVGGAGRYMTQFEHKLYKWHLARLAKR